VWFIRKRSDGQIAMQSTDVFAHTNKYRPPKFNNHESNLTADIGGQLGVSCFFCAGDHLIGKVGIYLEKIPRSKNNNTIHNHPPLFPASLFIQQRLI
jgi:hypothetical protein